MLVKQPNSSGLLRLSTGTSKKSIIATNVIHGIVVRAGLPKEEDLGLILAPPNVFSLLGFKVVGI